MFLVARDLYEMFVLCRGKHATRSSTVGIWSEVRVYCALVHEHIVHRRSAVGQVSRQLALDVSKAHGHYTCCILKVCTVKSIVYEHDCFLTFYVPRHCSVWHIFDCKSPAARARELFKPSTDLASPLVEIEKKLFFLFGGGFAGNDPHNWRCFRNFWPPLAGPGLQPIEPFFWLKVLL